MLPETMRLAVWTIGPLNADLLRRANTRLEDGEYNKGAGAASLNTEFILPLVTPISWNPLFVPRTKRILLGKRDEALGVVGSTLTEEWGDLEARAVGVDAEPMLFEETDDAFE
jgi:hypothetical protein